MANALATALQSASGALSSQAGDIRIIAEESSNSLLVRATDSDWALVQQVIGGVDLRPLQVLIEVTIAEVQRNRSIDFGVSGVSKRDNKTGNTASITGASQSSALDLIAELTGGHGAVSYDVALNALEQRGDVRVLSLPVIIAQNNRQAVLNVGSSRPFVQISQTVPNDPTGRVQTVQYIDVGTTLTITPTINPDGYVNLQVAQTDNSATNEVEFDAPVIDKREATTQIFIRDGQTTVIGGLADNTRQNNQSGLPFISRIPFIGALLFGNYSKSDATTRAVPLPHAAHHLERRRHRQAPRCGEGRQRPSQASERRSAHPAEDGHAQRADQADRAGCQAAGRLRQAASRLAHAASPPSAGVCRDSTPTRRRRSTRWRRRSRRGARWR